MALNVISNFAANVAHRNLVMSDASATSSLTKLSSGQRVVSAKDDAASLAIGSRLRAEVVAMRTASVNAGQAGSMLQIADGAMATISDILVRMKELAVQASSGQFSSTERTILDSEFQALVSEITRISDDTEFNGTQLLSGVAEATVAFNSAIGTDLTGITAVDFGTNGTAGNVASFSYVASTTTLTVTIGASTGTFDLSAQAAGTYTSTGTLAGVKVTLDGTFTFSSDFSNVDSTAVVGNSNLFQQTTEGAVLEAGDTRLDKANMVFDFKGSSNTFGVTEYLTVQYVDSTDVVTIKYFDASNAEQDSVTVDLTSSLTGGTQTFTLGGGNELAGVTMTLDVDQLDGGDTTTTISTASTTGGALVFDGTPLINANLVYNGTEIDKFTLSTIVFTVATDGTIAGTTTSGYVVSLADSDFNTSTNTPTIDILHSISGEIFSVEFTSLATAASGSVATVTLNLNELLNAYSIQAKADLVLESSSDAAIAITSSTFDAADLAALTQKTMTLSVSSAGLVTVKAGTGPTGWTVDAANSQALNATGNRNVILTDGTNSFTVQIDVSTAISQGAGAEIVVDLKELQDTVGLAAQLGKTSFTYKVGTGNQSYDNLTFLVTAASATALAINTNLITTAANAETASTAVSAAIDTLNQSRSDIGAAQNRLTFAAQNLASAIENAEAARSNLLDLDVAKEMSAFTSKQVLLQTGIAMLAQANQLPQNLLRLFQ